MARNFVIISQDRIDDRVAKALQAREFELASYDFEVQVHADTLANADSEWLDAREIDAHGNSTGVTNRDRIIAMKKAVEQQRSISEQRYAAQLMQLPEGPRRDNAIARLAAEQAIDKTTT